MISMADVQFLAELAAFELLVNQECEQFEIDVASEILDEINDTNPLDTVNSTARWTASLNSPIYDQASDVTESNRIGRETAKERSLSTLPNINGYKMGDIIYLSNGTNYISDLEAGKSLQAVNFVKLSALRYEQVIDFQLTPSV
jgi:hypothetical protein